LGVVEQLMPKLSRMAEPRLAGGAEGDRAPNRPCDEPDEYPDEDQHDSLLGRLSRRSRGPTRRRTGERESRIDEASRHRGSVERLLRRWHGPLGVGSVERHHGFKGSCDSEKAVMQEKRRVEHLAS